MNRKGFFAGVLLGVLIAIALVWPKASPLDAPPAGTPEPGPSRTNPSPAPTREPEGTRSAAPMPEVRSSGTSPVADPMREDEGVLHIDVVEAGGRPFAEAQVTLYLKGPQVAATGSPSWFVAGRGVTDATGSLRLPARPGHYLVSAKAGGFATALENITRPHGEAQTRARLILGPGSALAGTVVERASKAPVPFTELTLTARAVLGPVSRAKAAVPEEETHRITTDARGAFRWEGLAPGEYQLDAVAAGHAPRRIPRVRVPEAEFTVELDGSAFIEGFVELPEGGPATGARVIATGLGDIREAEASEGGGFSIEAPPGAYQVTAQQGALTGTAPERVRLGPGMTVRDVRIRLGDAATLVGMVRRRGSGEPIAGAVISLRPSALARLPETPPSEVASAISGADGRFKVGQLAPGAYSVMVKARGCRLLILDGTHVPAGRRLELILDMDTAGRIEGTVVDGDNKPLAGILVTPELRWRKGPLEGVLPTVSSTEGTFTLEDVPPIEVLLAAQRPGSQTHVRERVRVVSGQTARARLQLSSEGLLEGTVRMEDGRTPTGPVTVHALHTESPRTESHQISTSTDGTWSMRVRTGRYRVTAWLSETGNQNTDQEQVVDVEAEQTRRVDLQVREAKRPHFITVLEPNGAPSIGAIVMVSEFGRHEILIEDQTDTTGQVVIAADSLGSGPLRFWATNGGRRGEVSSVTTSRRDVVIPLQPSGRLTGSVRSAGGGTIEGFAMRVSSTKAEDDFPTTQEWEFAGARFTVDDVPVGRVVLSVTLKDKRGGKVETTSVAGATTQADIVVEAGGAVSGRLVDTSGAPLSRSFVDVGGRLSPMMPGGRFRVDDLAPGPHRILAFASKSERAEKSIHITAGKTLDLGDWMLEPTRLEPGRLGISFAMNGNDVTVRSVEEGLHGGLLLVGDVVKSIDGATVLTAGEARDRELGAPGSPATLVIRREAETYPITLTRAP
ncbi:carboxypeptidase-like regulatory domain-containing protein [Myxococcus landrumensis]|uniref:Carboxypeptidase regulatory-like domain-containing protein n=1 Tax=Myxococcus landrumensis TaxID=2813577 RepID=A0ABX7NA71_9BACT|nr:carboxypeptidase-like regulatory domain-containing protein [Myxococcus landrumus]QSQ15674.1 carboxypeptidase regulatory-like domain-containing protein [Myxococcus landrumus]